MKQSKLNANMKIDMHEAESAVVNYELAMVRRAREARAASTAAAWLEMRRAQDAHARSPMRRAVASPITAVLECRSGPRCLAPSPHVPPPRPGPVRVSPIVDIALKLAPTRRRASLATDA